MGEEMEDNRMKFWRGGGELGEPFSPQHRSIEKIPKDLILAMPNAL